MTARNPLSPSRTAASGTATALHIDWTACAAHGLCAELLPELLQLDEWGYPRALGYGSDIPVGPGELGAARVAVNLCPRQALALRATAATPTTR
ncbi:ferredoxin [Schumannella sp. 10F1B-5-1]|uniref:ferredoxin n=1 Tax=Schumannella sp. 10F1B-5-1 TaxID=2590780 RepID=UPI001131187C|nr:ferredoxin [Schumannella sp. 10F1B-5-1]TPW72978.1 ferredoxin [Schumannella sp. 10F1B-5-1]